MTIDTPTSERDEPDAGPLAGQRLAEARKAREISIFDIARELHLDEYKVQALEENQFDVLGAPVFAKGHLRKYAELVGVPVDDVMSDYYSLNRAVGAPPVVGKPRKQARELNIGRWVVAVLILVVVGGAVYWWFTRPPSADGESVAPSSSDMTQILLPATEDSGASDEVRAVAGDEGAAVEAQGTDEPVQTVVQNNDAVTDPLPAAAASVTTAVATPVPTSSATQVRLSMRFNGDCWTEVSDATGARLFFDLGRAGRTLNVSGEPPLRVLFGNSGNVTLTVDGRDFPITAAMRRGQTARMTINKP